MDAAAAAERVREFYREQLRETGAERYVLGVSGGVDSALAATLAVEAVGGDALVGLVMPGAPSDPGNMADAHELLDDLGAAARELDVAPVVREVQRVTPYDAGREALGNVRARVRMLLAYLETNVDGGLVVGASNRSEYLLGYFTKHGDGAADVRPLVDLYKTEVYEVARATGLDERFVEKEPTAGLWEGQTDAGELGATYGTIDPVLRGVVDEGLSVEETAERTGVDRETVERFSSTVEATAHKRRDVPFPGMGDLRD